MSTDRGNWMPTSLLRVGDRYHRDGDNIDRRVQSVTHVDWSVKVTHDDGTTVRLHKIEHVDIDFS